MEERMKEIYKDLEHAIEMEQEEEAEKLVNVLAKEKGMTEEISMPKDFVKQIQRREGRKVMSNKGRILKVAAASLSIVCALGGTTYAATHWNFDDIRFTDSGIMTIESGKKDGEIKIYEDGNGKTSIEQYGNGDSNVTKTEIVTDGKSEDVETFAIAGGLEEPKVQILEEQEGNQDTNWSHKVTKLETAPTYSSDDGKEWKKDGESKYQYTNYTYDTWEKLRADKVMPDIFSEKAFEGYELDDSKLVYQEGHTDAKEKITEKSLEAVYLNGKKKMELKLGIDKMQEELGEDAITVNSVISSEDGKSENQRFYTTKENVKYALEDVKRNGTKSTFAYLSGNGCSIAIFFTDMSEKEIQTVLESIDATALLEKTAK